MKEDENRTDLYMIDLSDVDDIDLDSTDPEISAQPPKVPSHTQKAAPEAVRKPRKRPADARKTTSGKANGHKSGANKSGTNGTKKSGSKKTGSKKSGSSKASSRRKKKKKQKIKATYIHLAFTGLIILIAIVAIVKLVLWNRGRESEYDPTEDTSQFDMEPEDHRVPLTSSAAAMQKDDGITTILLLGNGTLAKTKGEESSIGKRLETLTGGKVYDASLDHTYLSVKNASYDPSYPTDVFSLYWMSYCISSGEFALLEDTAKTWEGDDSVRETVDMLKELDMGDVDVITILYDSHDYEDKRLLSSPYDDTLPVTCCGCLYQSVKLLKEAFPHIRIIISSPYFCYVEDENGEQQDSGMLDMGQGSLADYMIAYKNIAVGAGVSYIDNYYGTVTPENYEQYLEDDKEHLNEAGRNAIAERIAGFIGTQQASQ